MLALAVQVGSVAAHTALVDAEPAPGAKLPSSPAEVRLTFTEALQPGSTFAVFGEFFNEIEGVTPQIDPGAPEQMAAAFPPLGPGTYTVQWVAIGDDGDKVNGSYSFNIQSGPSLGIFSPQEWFGVLFAVGFLGWFVYRRLGRKSK